MRPHNIITQQPFDDFQANVNEDKPNHSEIVICLRDRFLYMDLTQDAYMQIMFDLRYPQSMICPMDNSHLQRFLNSLHTWLRRAGLNHQYVWVWEESRDGGHHYHVCLLVQASSYYPFHTVMEKIKALWGLGFGITGRHGLVWDYTKDTNGNPIDVNGRIISHDDPNRQQVLNNGQRWASYLAKCRTKENCPENLRGYGASQLPDPSTWMRVPVQRQDPWLQRPPMPR
jgi:hypothetical protein